MSIEQKINYQLNKVPALKKALKRFYQLGMYAICIRDGAETEKRFVSIVFSKATEDYILLTSYNIVLFSVIKTLLTIKIDILYKHHE